MKTHFPAVYKIAYRHLDMKDLWRGEVTRKHSFPREQGDCALNKYLTAIECANESEARVSSRLNPEAFELADEQMAIQGDSFLQSLEKEGPGGAPNQPASLILDHYRLDQEMASIVGSYQHERNENLDEYFKAVGVPYIPRKMMCMTSPRLEILNDDDKWTLRTISMIRTTEVTFSLGEEYEEHMPAGVTLKNVTTMEGDSLVTVSVGPDDNKVIRKYEITEDGVLLTMTHESSGQVGKRYFKRLS